MPKGSCLTDAELILVDILRNEGYSLIEISHKVVRSADLRPLFTNMSRDTLMALTDIDLDGKKYFQNEIRYQYVD